MKNILIALDLLDSDHVLLENGKELAQKFDAKLWLVHIAAPEPSFVGYDVGPQYIRDIRAEDLREEHRKIQAYAQELETQQIESEGLLIQGETVKTLLEEAESIPSDLIILGNHQHGVLYNIMFGNTTNQVVRHATTKLLIVPC